MQFLRDDEIKSMALYRLSNGAFILTCFILTAAYSGSLVSLLSVDVYPKPPNTLDELAKKIGKENMEVNYCCFHIKDFVRQKPNDPYKTLWEHVSNF